MTDQGGALRAGLAQPHGFIDRTSSRSAPLYVEDRDCWLKYLRDRWVYNRLELSERLRYPCGPAGVPTPWLGEWWSKPIINLRGMGLGGRQVADAAHVPPGHFWAPCFEGAHVSVNYQRRTLDDLPTRGVWSAWRVVEALRSLRNAEGQPAAWIKTTEVPLLPVVFTHDVVEADQLNVEYIGGFVIEAHLRHGFDFAARPDAVAALVVWEGDPQLPPDGPGFVSDVADGNGRRRLGFYYVR